MSRDDDEDELVVPYPKHLVDAFRDGFTVPERYRMNSVYGKYASDGKRELNVAAVTGTIMLLAAHRARRVMRVI